MTELAKPELVVIIHGIRDIARWQADIASTLEKAGFNVELTNYGRMNIFQFLLPIGFFRQRAVKIVANQIRHAIHLHPESNVSFIAHSFGTYILASILKENFDLKINRIIFCGSVVRYSFPFEQMGNRYRAPLLNEVGTADPWPALAESITTGYGSAGTFGFRRPGVRDRFHNDCGHGFFLTSAFCQKYWVPFLSVGTFVPSELPAKQPPLWVRLISIFKLKAAISAIIVGAIAFFIVSVLTQAQGGLIEKFTRASDIRGIVALVDANVTVPPPPPQTKCDQLASIPNDEGAVARPLSWDAMRASLAVSECVAAIKDFGPSPRLVTQLARAVEKSGDCTSAIDLYDFAIKNGYAVAALQRGYIHKEKLCETDSIEEALRYFEISRSLGSIEAIYEIGVLYEYGIGIEQDVKEACQRYELAASLGSLRGMRNIARCYDDGGLNSVNGSFSKIPSLAACWNLLSYVSGHPTSRDDLLEKSDKWSYEYRSAIANMIHQAIGDREEFDYNDVHPKFGDKLVNAIERAKGIPLNNRFMLQNYRNGCFDLYGVDLKISPHFLENFQNINRGS